jgi:hypothetical protein
VDILRGIKRGRGGVVRAYRRARRHGVAAARGTRMIQQPHHPLVWLVLAALLAYVTYLIFRAYLNPDFLIGYANMFSC